MLLLVLLFVEWICRFIILEIYRDNGIDVYGSFV